MRSYRHEVFRFIVITMYICITDLFMDENNDFKKNKNNHGLWTTYLLTQRDVPVKFFCLRVPFLWRSRFFEYLRITKLIFFYIAVHNMTISDHIREWDGAN